MRREIGRGKFYFLIVLGSYGVVFKASRVDDNDYDQNGKKR